MGQKVYTEDVGSSSLSSPTIFPNKINVISGLYEELFRFAEPLAPFPCVYVVLMVVRFIELNKR